MTQQGREPLIYVALVILLALPFAADLLFPLGTAVWVGYFLPVVCAYLAPRPLAPLIVAAMATLLTIVGFTLAPAGVDPQVAIINRSIGCITTFILAFTGYGLIRSRLAVQH